jgi:RimJ/RimL family protein N-acetyltransferase
MKPWFPLETERLSLREFRAADEARIHDYASDPEVARLMIWGPNAPEATHQFLERMLKAQERWTNAIARPTSATSSIAAIGAAAT